MIALLIAAALAIAGTIIGTPFLITVLQRRGIGQLIRDDGPFAHPHVAKAGTPTMGGIAIVLSATAGYFVAHYRTNEIKFARTGLALVLLIVGMAAVGFVDDYLGVRRGRNLGLRKRGKVAGQLVVAVLFVLVSLHWVHTSTNLSFTRTFDVDLGPWGWGALAVFIIMAAANGVNLTDGMDGLAAGSGTLVFAALVIICFWQFRHHATYHVLGAGALDLAVVAAAFMGACAGFLWWNAAPARVFMGDIGSLALGGAMAGIALLANIDLLLPIIGGLYVIETMSVIVQVVAFRGFKRRVFRMAPLHHHFEVGGWPEFTVIVRFWLLSGLFVALGTGLFYADFLRLGGLD
ncbi:MAG: phospho-N-acetylmuramoyl-pentapeptide-transferase [Acidimicrobiia bacterium]